MFITVCCTSNCQEKINILLKQDLLFYTLVCSKIELFIHHLQMSRTKDMANRHCATRKSIVDHCTTFMVSLIVLCVLAKFRDAFPFNYLILCIWLFALIVSVPPACSMIIFQQDRSENDIEELFPSTIFPSTIHISSSRDNFIEILKLYRPNSKCICDSLKSHQMLFVKAGLLTTILSLSLIVMEFQFKLSTTHVEHHLTSIRIAFSCWWSYSLLSGLKFGSYAVTESQHRWSYSFIAP
jgi:hypothetical protein